MTAAFNLSQLANNLNTSGQLDATDGLSGLIANANLASSGTASSSTFLRGDRTWSSSGLGKVLQVVQTNFTGTATSTSATPADVSGFSASITPSSSSNKILVMVTVFFGFNVDAYPYVLLKRNGTQIGNGVNATGNQVNVFLSGPNVSGVNSASEEYKYVPASKNFLDSPATTSALTYQIALAQPWTGTNGHINRQEATNNEPYVQSTSSTITLMEIAA